MTTDGDPRIYAVCRTCKQSYFYYPYEVSERRWTCNPICEAKRKAKARNAVMRVKPVGEKGVAA